MLGLGSGIRGLGFVPQITTIPLVCSPFPFESFSH